MDKAIENAQKFLLSQRGNAIPGTWEIAKTPDPKDESPIGLGGHQYGGLTSIATYALLASGMNPQDKDLKPAVSWLISNDHPPIVSTYGIGLSSQLVSFSVPEKEYAPLLKRNVAMVLAGVYRPPNLKTPGAPHDGFYSYYIATDNKPVPTNVVANRGAGPKLGGPAPADHFDRSNGQYGVLGAWALTEAGGEIPSWYWELEDAAWKRAQHHDGGWDYSEGGDQGVTASMTAAGIATLFITQDYTLSADWSACKGGIRNTYIDAGLAWMDKHIGEAINGSNHYTMYGVERIGTASGRKYFGTVDWYQVGAEALVRSQGANGSWGGAWGPIPETSFALVFLARGRAPVMMNKLMYDYPKNPKLDPWNERPRDVANLSHWVGKQLETYLNWQVVNLKVKPEELHDAPILYISGNTDLPFTDEEINKLRTFVEEGGMILGNSDCGKEPFNKAFEALGKKLFPKYEFKAAPPNDLMYNEQFKTWRIRPKVMQLTNGVRKLMVCVPELDPSRFWQTKSYTNKDEAYHLGANLFLYSVDKKNLLSKGETYIVQPTGAAGREFKIARLDLGDNPNPEPGAWTRLAAIVHNNDHIDLKPELVKPEALAAGGYKVADLTGTGKLQLGPAARDALKKFVTDGGTLIIDAAAGDSTFADSAEVELRGMFGEKSLQKLPETDAIYNGPDGKPMAIGWRRYAVDHGLADRKHGHVMGVTLAGRTAVFFSRDDLTAGLVGEPVDGIYGYDPATATQIMRNIVIGLAK